MYGVFHARLELAQLLHFLHVGPVLLGILLVDACLAVLDDDHLLEQFVLLCVQQRLLLLADLLARVLKVNLEQSLALLDNLLLLLLRLLDLGTQFHQLLGLLLFCLLFFGELLLQVVRLVLQLLLLVRQFDELCMNYLVGKLLGGRQCGRIRVATLRELKLCFLLIGPQLLVVFDEFIDCTLVIFALLVQFLKVRSILDLVVLLLQAL